MDSTGFTRSLRCWGSLPTRSADLSINPGKAAKLLGALAGLALPSLPSYTGPQVGKEGKPVTKLLPRESPARPEPYQKGRALVLQA